MAVIVLASFAYPSVQVPLLSTLTFSNVSTAMQSVTLSTIATLPYGTSILTSISYSNQPGNFPGCDPASMACNYGFLTPYFSYYTFTYSALATSFYQVTAATQWTVTNESTQTNYREIPIYASLGLSDSQFALIAALTLIIALGIFAFTRRAGWKLDRSSR